MQGTGPTLQRVKQNVRGSVEALVISLVVVLVLAAIWNFAPSVITGVAAGGR
jgi:hypothetical protein